MKSDGPRPPPPQTSTDDHAKLRDLILSECDRATFQVLLENLGVKRTIELIGVHTRHSGLAVANNARQRLGFKGNGLEQLGTPFYWLHTGLSGGHISLRIFQMGAVIELTECPLRNVHPALCVAASHYIGNGICEVINPDYEYVFTHHLTNGDPYCRAVIKRKGERILLDDLGELVREAPSLNLPQGEIDYLRSSTIGETLIILTKVFMETLDRERLTRMVVPRLIISGREFAERSPLGSVDGKGDIDVRSKAELITSSMNMTTEVVKDVPEGIAYEVLDCPFKTAPTEVCDQIMAFFDGMYKALDPRFCFHCEERMTLGHKTCKCRVVRGLDERMNETMLVGEVVHEDPLVLLKRRLAKGEISMEEYNIIKTILLD